MILADGDTHPAAAPEPVVRGAARPSERRRHRGRTIDLSGTLAEVTRRVTREVEKLKIEEVLRGGAAATRGAPRSCCRSATRCCSRSSKELRHRIARSSTSLHAPIASAQRAARSSRPASRPSTTSHAPIAVGSTKCSCAGDDFLVVARSPRATSASGQVGDGRQRPHLRDERPRSASRSAAGTSSRARPRARAATSMP